VGKYDAAIETAHRLIESSGELSSLIRTVGGEPVDPNKPWIRSAPVETTYQVHTVWITESILRRESTLTGGDVYTILAAKDLAVVPDPTTDHIVRADGRRYAIVSVDPLDINGQKIIFEIKARS
jgi:hypothetical protein